MEINIPKETHGIATISAVNDTAFFTGEIGQADPGEFLIPFFEKINAQMGEMVKLNFTALDFLNSSGIKCIVSFVMEKKPGTKVVFIIDKNKTWQRTSLEIVQSLDEEDISLEDGE